MGRRIGHVHFVGIGGTGMCGIAEVLHNMGYLVTGSDLQCNDATNRLENELGIKVHHKHEAANVHGADVVVVSTAIRRGNPEVEAAEKLHIPVIPRAQMLAELMRFKPGIAVAGTHGKTTTTSLVASILAAADMDPTYVIGGLLKARDGNAKLGEGDYIVAEADESDASFLYLTPMYTIVTNIDFDHMDTYGHDVEALHKAFIEFIHRMPFYGKSFVCVDDEHVRQIIPSINKPYATYGIKNIEEADIWADNIRADGPTMRFTCHVRDRELQFGVHLNFPGEHSVCNALAAIGVALECGCSIDAIRKGLEEFEGVARRFESWGDIYLPDGKSKIAVYDDYGHHPREMNATITAARNAFPDKRIVLAFQPHRYSRTKDLMDSFVDIISTVDEVILTDVYPAGEDMIPGADTETLIGRMKSTTGKDCSYEPDVKEMHKKIYGVLKDNDLLLTMGAGSINKVAKAITEFADPYTPEDVREKRSK